MATALLPIDPATSPQQVNRILTISASLLPEETIAGRRARRARLWTAVVVALVAALCAAWFAKAHHDKQVAADELQAAEVNVTDLQRQQREYAETVQVQNDTKTLNSQLKAVMAKDLDWNELLDTVRNAGRSSDIEITAISADTGADGKATVSANALPGTDGDAPAGSLVVTGTAPDKKAVAAYVDALAQQTTVANPYVTNVATTKAEGKGSSVTFSMNVDITPRALCGRFTVKCKLSGGN
jgi:hypothetical protein